jgi:trans-aconitate 2-methyltransferase
MTTWDPSQYLRFADHRLRPAIDLLARVPLDAPADIVDLGCGTGTSTRLLRDRWPSASLSGIDDSKQMLAKAAVAWDERPAAACDERPPAHECGSVSWVEADLNTWRPPAPLDLVFTNAALQWLPGHGTLMPRLLECLKPGGVLAVQMPRNGAAISHAGQRRVVEAGPWRDRLLPRLREAPVAEPSYYYDLLAPHCVSVDLWESEYTHVLQGEDAVLQWTRGTSLRPLLDGLEPDEQVAFETRFRALLAPAYPRRADGTTLFPFRRLFFVAVRR